MKNKKKKHFREVRILGEHKRISRILAGVGKVL
jgi:hypothetical protein